MDNTTLILIGIGLLLLAWVVYKKFVALPPRPTECETKCVDGVCFPQCSTSSNPKLSIGDHGSETINDEQPVETQSEESSASDKKNE
jgi:hypothetical protein